MIAVIILGLIAIFFAYTAKNQENATGLKISFLLIFIFLALRYDFGNDYMAYYYGFLDITASSKIFLTGERWESGWRFLHIIFKPFGFFVMTASLALFNCFVYYRFIKKYVPSNFYWLAVFLYVFNPYMMMVQSSAMRQSLAISLFLFSIDFIVRKRLIPYLICAALALSMHKSGLVLLPLFVLGFFNWRINKVLAISIVFFFVSLFIFGENLYFYFHQLTVSYFPQYADHYYGGKQFNTGYGLIFMLFQLICVLYFAGMEFGTNSKVYSLRSDQLDQDDYDDIEHDQMEYSSNEYLSDDFSANQAALTVDSDKALLGMKARRILYIFAIMTFMFIPLSLSMGMITRINMYFSPVLIAVYPIVLYKTKNEFFRLVFLFSLMAFTLLTFLTFFLDPMWYEFFGRYQTIFSAPKFH